jgi:hypothetical protein
MQSQQIRRPLPRTVTPVSSRYPQLLCVFECDFAKNLRAPPAMTHEVNSSTADASASGLTMHQCGGRQLRRSGTANAHLHDFKTTVWIAGSAVRVR